MTDLAQASDARFSYNSCTSCEKSYGYVVYIYVYISVIFSATLAARKELIADRAQSLFISPPLLSSPVQILLVFGQLK